MTEFEIIQKSLTFYGYKVVDAKLIQILIKLIPLIKFKGNDVTLIDLVMISNKIDKGILDDEDYFITIKPKVKKEEEEYLNEFVSSFHFPQRAMNTFRDLRIITLRDLYEVNTDILFKQKNIGRDTIFKIQMELERNGLPLIKVEK
jgi:DNA-directed RNA polymerase alpha subunit